MKPGSGSLQVEPNGPVHPRATNARVVVMIQAIVLIGARWAAQSEVASTYPRAAALLLLWIVADTLMLGMMALNRQLSRQQVVAVLAAASVVVLAGAPAPLRAALFDMPMLLVPAAMTGAIAAHAWISVRKAAAVLRVNRGPYRYKAALTRIASPLLARTLHAELVLLSMLLRGRDPVHGRRPETRRAFFYHRYLVPMLWALMAISLIELVVVHILLSHWFPTGSLVVGAITLIGMIYLAAFARSIRLRPVMLGRSRLFVRLGAVKTVSVPRSAIAEVSIDPSSQEVRDRGNLDLCLFGGPNVRVGLRQPLVM